MTPVIPTITAAYAALLGLLAVLLAVRVIRLRGSLAVEIGDGGKAPMAQAIRAHANFAEHVPMALIVLAFAEALGSPALAVHGLAIVLLVARGLSAWGLSRSLGPTTPRQAGAGLTVLVVVLSCALILYRTLVR